MVATASSDGAVFSGFYSGHENNLYFFKVWAKYIYPKEKI
jgi:hypothetical protein